ncbi:aromatase/cyclase [Nocardia sp. NPDC051030]|uniref:aromatase/cyclase n=1 Tax=Nocardia sp. NPDC051030 TaxID=3155162 RepID=UPI00343D724B
MSQSEQHEVEHQITIDAPADRIYRLIADVEGWPQLFGPTIYADYLERGEREELIRIWATANGEVKNWTSRRALDPDQLRIDFRQAVSAAPIAAMGGAWVIEAVSDTRSRVRLLHDYRAVADHQLGWIDKAVDRNSRAELAALKTTVEHLDSDPEAMFSFEDTVHIDGSASDAFDFVNDAQLWVDRLPHVAAVRLDEAANGLQTLEMETRSTDGATHLTKSYRVTFPHRKIAYKQVTMPKLMTLHTGYWTFRATETGVAASSQHTVVLNTGNITAVLGRDANVATARDYVRNALSTNSTATLTLAKHYAESGR